MLLKQQSERCCSVTDIPKAIPFTSENINRRIQYFAENELERHAVLSGGKEANND